MAFVSQILAVLPRLTGEVALVRNRRGHDLIGVIARYLRAYLRPIGTGHACTHRVAEFVRDLKR
jgi:hypothetical protein